MKNISTSKAVFLVIMAAAVISSGCSMLGGGGGGGGMPDAGSILGGLTPSGAGLTEGAENEMFMTANEQASGNLPYQVRPSNKALATPDGGKIYGAY